MAECSTNFGHVTKVTKTSYLILHKMTSTDLDECLKTRFRPQIGSSRVGWKIRIREEFAKSGTLINIKYRWIFSYLFKRYLSLRSMFQMFSFFQVTNKNQRKTIVNSWVRCLENNQLVITSGFPTVNFRK